MSSEQERKLEGGEAPPPPPPPQPEPKKDGLHPAFYIAYVIQHWRKRGWRLTASRLWIAMSGSVIVFNKWVLHTAKFGK